MNPMPIFHVYKNNMFQGTISAVSEKQALQRARKRFGRNALDIIGMTNLKAL